MRYDDRLEGTHLPNAAIGTLRRKLDPLMTVPALIVLRIPATGFADRADL